MNKPIIKLDKESYKNLEENIDFQKSASGYNIIGFDCRIVGTVYIAYMILEGWEVVFTHEHSIILKRKI